VTLDVSDEDADLRAHLAALGPGALDELECDLWAPTSHWAAILTALVARPAYADHGHPDRPGRHRRDGACANEGNRR
jgi:hypothetical protein